MSNLQQNLIKLGLSESDALIYIILVENGEMDVPSLVDKSSLSRTTIYDSIESLKKYKLLSQKKIGKIVYYNVKHPQHLLSLIEEKKQADLEWERNIKNDVKLFTDKYSLASENPGIYIFHGKEGIIKTYEELLKDRQNIDSIEDKGEMFKFIPEYSKKIFPDKRKKYNIFNRVIAPNINQINPTCQKQLRETRLLDVNLFPFSMDIKINKKKIVMVTFKGNSAVGVVIIHPEIVKNFQILFDYFWQTAAR